MDSAPRACEGCVHPRGVLVGPGEIASDRALISGGLRDKSLVAMHDHTEVRACV